VNTVKIFVNDREREVPLAFRAVYLLAIEEVSPRRRIIKDESGLLTIEYHPNEWIVPGYADRFQIVPYAIGPGGGSSHRVKLIDEAIGREYDAELALMDEPLEAARAELALAMPVVEAALAFRDSDVGGDHGRELFIPSMEARDAVRDAVDAYRASKEPK